MSIAVARPAESNRQRLVRMVLKEFGARAGEPWCEDYLGALHDFLQEEGMHLLPNMHGWLSYALNFAEPCEGLGLIRAPLRYSKLNGRGRHKLAGRNVARTSVLLRAKS